MGYFGSGLYLVVAYSIIKCQYLVIICLCILLKLFALCYFGMVALEWWNGHSEMIFLEKLVILMMAWTTTLR